MTTRLASQAKALRRSSWNARAAFEDRLTASTRLPVERLASGGECLREHRPDLRLEPPPDDHHAVFVLIHVQGQARPVRSLSRWLGPGGESVFIPMH